MIAPKKMRFYGLKDIENIPQLKSLSEDDRFVLKVVSNVLPFRTNNYVVENLIDWNNIPDDPMFQLTFPQRGMISKNHFDRMADALRKDSSQDEINSTAHEIRMELNPHPGGQMTINVPTVDDNPIPGVQHKYRETCLIFPSAGQTCHAYCTFCFRWAQFVGMNGMKLATDESKKFQKYIRDHKEITDVLVTGGDPMIMSAKNLSTYLKPFLKPEFDHIKTIRIGTKAAAYWPYKFVTDKDADDTLRLFEKIVKTGKHLAVMGHFNHWVELSTDVVKEAIARIRNTGAQIRTQSPLVKHVNDDPEVWTRMWNEQVNLGCIPYYFFVERNTGAKEYFEIPLIRAYHIFKEAYSKVSGLGRTVRGPSMSALPGKVAIDGITEINGEKVFVLKFLQGRNPDWVKRPFFAKFNEKATWLTDLKPALGDTKFFYQDDLNKIIRSNFGQMFFIDRDSGDTIDSDIAA